MEILNIVPVDYSNQRVMTSKQLADALSDRDEVTGNIAKAVTVENILRNFSNNRDQFVEGRDYFKLTGEELRDFQKSFPEVVPPRIPVFTLWTEWGAMLHAKMVNSDTAWKKYQALVQFYFHYRDVVATPILPPPFDMQTFQAAFRDVVNAAVRDAVSTLETKITELETKSTELDEKVTDLLEAQLKSHFVYVLQMSNDRVKVGYSGEMEQRFRSIQCKTGLKIFDCHVTPRMSEEQASLVEKLTQLNYSRL